MALTGEADGPALDPGSTAAELAARWAAPFDLDERVLGERAALAGLSRRGIISAGGACRMLRAADGWIAISLARPEDIDSVPAVIEAPVTGDPWEALADHTRNRPSAEVVDRCLLLAMAASVVGREAGRADPAAADAPGEPSGEGPAGSATIWTRPPRVLDLGALWAGPLAAHLLGRVGAEVVKVESTSRPDGARRGPAEFYDLMNHGKASVALDLTTPAGRDRLAALVDAADIVISASRARALHQLGLDPERFLAGATDRVWVAITGHGWDRDRIAFGDDAAAGAGLVAWTPAGRPCFAGDAIADPLTGLRAAATAARAWARGGQHLLDVSLISTAALAAPPPGTPTRPARPDSGDGAGGETSLETGAETSVQASGSGTGAETSVETGGAMNRGRWTIGGEQVACPEPRPAPGPAAALGVDTEQILARWLR